MITRRLRPLASRLAGPVPGRYWLLLAVLFTIMYVFWRAVGKPWTGDALYYTAMTFDYAGYDLNEAVRLTGEYFNDPEIDRLHNGFASPKFAPLVYPRLVYPVLSVPFVLLLGGSGMYVVPLLSAIFVVWGLTRLLARLFNPHIALAVTALFVTTLSFREFGTGLFTESPSMAFLVGMLLLFPLGGRRFGRWEAVGCAVLLVLIAFCRQSAPVVVAAVCGAWLWTAVAERRIRGNPWNLPLAVLLPIGAAVTLFLQWWAPYDVIAWYVRINDEPNARSAFLHFPQIAWGVLRTDIRNFLSVDIGMLVIWLAGLIGCLVRPLSVRTGMLVGALGPSVLIATLNSKPSSLRYYVPMYPILVLAAAGLFYLVLVRLREPGPTATGDRDRDGDREPEPDGEQPAMSQPAR